MSDTTFCTNCTNALSKIDRCHVMVAAISLVILAVALTILFAPITLPPIAFLAAKALLSLGGLLLAGTIAIAIIRVKDKLKTGQNPPPLSPQDIMLINRLARSEIRLNRATSFSKLVDTYKGIMNSDAALLGSSINFMAFTNDNSFSATCSDEQFAEIMSDLGRIFAKQDFKRTDLASMNLSTAFRQFMSSEINIHI